MYWIIVERPENWEADKKNSFAHFGLPQIKEKLGSKIAAGVAAWISGKALFAALLERPDPGHARTMGGDHTRGDSRLYSCWSLDLS